MQLDTRAFSPPARVSRCLEGWPMLDPALPLMMIRRERYAQARARGLIQEDAHAAAGFPEPNSRAAASAMEYKAGVKERIAWLVQEHAVEDRAAQVHEVERVKFEEAMGKAAILAGLREVFSLAIECPSFRDKEGKVLAKGEPNNLAAANRALELMGKEEGMFVDRKHVTTTQEGDGMDKPALLRAIQSIDRQLADLGVKPMIDVTPGASSGPPGKALGALASVE